MHKSSIFTAPLFTALVLAALIGCEQANEQAEQDQSVQQEDHTPRVATDAEAHAPEYGGGIVSEPVRQLRTVENRILKLNITRAMSAFRAEHQRSPESHEEFMEEIIQKNFISLPELEADWEYQYDPEAIDEETGQAGKLLEVYVGPE